MRTSNRDRPHGWEDVPLKVSKLPKILPGVHPDLPSDAEEQTVLGIAHDSRRVKPGWVFVAIKGHQRDGTHFAEDALYRGAVAVVTEQALRLSIPVPQFIVPDARRALAALAHTFYRRPSRHMKVVGVTGTNGKTTTSCMVRAILEEAGRRCGLLGTIQYDTGRRILPASITTPESVDVQDYLSEMRDAGAEYAALEVSSHALCMRRVDFVQFAVGVFTNLTSEHLDYHQTMTRYRQAKAHLFRSLGPTATAVLNADDKSSAFMARATRGKVVKYGLDSRADVRGRIKKATLDGLFMNIACDAGKIDVHLPLIGRHNAYNALASAAAAMVLGLDLECVRRGLEVMSEVPGRLETVPCDKGYKVLVDYAHTDGALEAVLQSLRRVAKKRILVVFGAGGNRDHAKRPRMGRVVEKGADVAWVTSDNPRGEAPDKIIDDILSGVHHKKRMRVQPDRQTAINEALHAARPGDLVLIAGKGHERTQRFKDTVVPFDDRLAVQQALSGDESTPHVMGN